MRGGLGDRLPYQLKLKKSWSWRRELNPRPSDYKSDALPTELRQPACLSYHFNCLSSTVSSTISQLRLQFTFPVSCSGFSFSLAFR